MDIREGFPGTPTAEETDEINQRVAIATVDTWGNFDQALKMADYMDMWQRQAVARLVDRMPGEAGTYGITQENKAKIQVVLSAQSYIALMNSLGE